jgi:hypothetical protein
MTTTSMSSGFWRMLYHSGKPAAAPLAMPIQVPPALLLLKGPLRPMA